MGSKCILLRIPEQQSAEVKTKVVAEVTQKKGPMESKVRLTMQDPPEKILNILDTPYRCFDCPKQDNAKLLLELLQLGCISTARGRNDRKYRCRYSPDWLRCELTTPQSGSDIVRHLGTHANSERSLIEEGHLEQMDAAMLNIYMANPGLAETIDPEFCTCYVCDISFVRKDSMERHLKTQHDAPATLIKDISAAIRGRKMNLGH